MVKVKRGPKGTTVIRKYMKDFDRNRYLSVAELEIYTTLETEQIVAVLNYLIETNDLTVVYGLSNFIGSPVYSDPELIPVYSNVKTQDGYDYWITPETIIPLYLKP